MLTDPVIFGAGLCLGSLMLYVFDSITRHRH